MKEITNTGNLDFSDMQGFPVS